MTHTSSVCRLEESTYIVRREREKKKKDLLNLSRKTRNRGGDDITHCVILAKLKKCGLSESHAEDEGLLLCKSEQSFHWLNLLPFLHLLSSAAAAAAAAAS